MLLIEQNIDEPLDIIEEGRADGEGSNMYIQGLFLKANTPNRNKRVYPKPILEKQVNDYIENFVNKNCALGELDHPNAPGTNLQRVSHMVENLVGDGDAYYGRARLLNTPMGNIAKNLIREGVSLGVSSRGTGSVIKRGNSLVVAENYKLLGIDLVCTPSVQDAVVEAVYENQDWTLDLFNSQEEFYNFRKVVNNSIRTLKLKNILKR